MLVFSSPTPGSTGAPLPRAILAEISASEFKLVAAGAAGVYAVNTELDDVKEGLAAARVSAYFAREC
ncbi:hypothetical protein A9Q90_02395 [Gammaproteobacteria bacterium 54_18_T64]|nr:hypothetical protein A9Q90_02395 [Gammaproteobacteria bacterium 54_18_T64]